MRHVLSGVEFIPLMKNALLCAVSYGDVAESLFINTWTGATYGRT